MNYYQMLKREMDRAVPATGQSREELEAGIAAIGKALIGPLGDGERIGLCADRASLRKALAALPATTPGSWRRSANQ